MSSEEAIEILKGWQKARTVLHSRFGDLNTSNDRELCVMFSSVTSSELWVVDAGTGQSKPMSLDGAAFAYSAREGKYSIQITFADGSHLVLSEQPPLETARR